MKNEHLKLFQKEIYSLEPINVFYVIQRFPGFEGYTGGGAERHLERLIQATRAQYDGNFKPKLYVANKQMKPSQLDIPIIADPDRISLLTQLHSLNTPDQILHLCDSYVILYNPEIFAEIENGVDTKFFE